jgi:hypothetical protein
MNNNKMRMKKIRIRIKKIKNIKKIKKMGIQSTRMKWVNIR